MELDITYKVENGKITELPETLFNGTVINWETDCEEWDTLDISYQKEYLNEMPTVMHTVPGFYQLVPVYLDDPINGNDLEFICNVIIYKPLT